MRQSRAPRVIRGVVAASLATFVAFVSHVSAGGSVPGWLGIVVPWVLSVTVCVVLAGRRLSLWTMAAGVAVSQALFHTLFVLGAPGPATSAQLAHHAHGPMPMLAGADATAAIAPTDPAMWMLHGLAAVVTVAALYRGERALLRLRALAVQLAAWVRRQLIRPLVVAILLPRARVLADLMHGRHIVPAPHLTSLRRRGPPLPLAL